MNRSQTPLFSEGGLIYAAIDTANQRVFMLTGMELWQYDLEQEQWSFLDSLKILPGELGDYEFGYNQYHKKLQLWSQGVGKVYEIDLKITLASTLTLSGSRGKDRDWKAAEL